MFENQHAVAQQDLSIARYNFFLNNQLTYAEYDNIWMICNTLGKYNTMCFGCAVKTFFLFSTSPERHWQMIQTYF